MMYLVMFSCVAPLSLALPLSMDMALASLLISADCPLTVPASAVAASAQSVSSLALVSPPPRPGTGDNLIWSHYVPSIAMSTLANSKGEPHNTHCNYQPFCRAGYIMRNAICLRIPGSVSPAVFCSQQKRGERKYEMKIIVIFWMCRLKALYSMWSNFSQTFPASRIHLLLSQPMPTLNIIS